MKEIFKRTTNTIICSSIIAFIIGLIMVINPVLSLESIGITIGIYIILHGIILIALDIKAKMYYIPFEGFITGILYIILGISLIAMPDTLSIALTLALGTWIILTSVNIIKIAIIAKKFTSNWILLLIFGILDLISGTIIIFNPFASSISIALITGIIIMTHSITNIINMIIIKKDVKDITKAIENTIKDKRVE